MERHFVLTDDLFVKQFQSCQLDPSLFTHEAHLRLAWYYIKEHGLITAIELLCEQIKKYDAIHGDGRKFHMTLTVAAANVIKHFIRQSSAFTFKEFITEFPRLKEDFDGVIASHYGFDILTSARARKEYIKPDLLPFK